MHWQYMVIAFPILVRPHLPSKQNSNTFMHDMPSEDNILYGYGASIHSLLWTAWKSLQFSLVRAWQPSFIFGFAAIKGQQKDNGQDYYWCILYCVSRHATTQRESTSKSNNKNSRRPMVNEMGYL